MAKVPEAVRKMLKKPLGNIYPTYEKVTALSKDFRIIAVGDVCTLALLAIGIVPHLAVFDHYFMRRKLEKERIDILTFTFQKIKTFENKAGTLSEELVNQASALIEEGGAILIDGEEDLTALAFINAADKKTIVIYGQPNKGVVVVEPVKKTKEFVAKMINLILKKPKLKKAKQKKNKKRIAN